MRKLFLVCAIFCATLTTTSQAIDLKGLLNGANIGDAVTGLVDGLLTQSDITVEQMAGTWTATGSAVCFQSENFLQKAGGSAAAGTIESKLNPYYQKYGLTGSVLTVQPDGTFTLNVKGITMKGTITKATDGNFNFKFQAFGTINLGTIKAYVEKPLTGLNVMFDASKLKTFLSTAASFTGNSLATTAANLLDSYDGLCVGFAFSGSGSAPSTSTPSTNNTNTNTNTNTNNQTTNSGSDLINKAGNALKNIFGK